MENGEAYFGQNFKINSEKTLDPLRREKSKLLVKNEQQEEGQSRPDTAVLEFDHMNIGQEVRDLLKQDGSEFGYGEINSTTNSIESFLSEANQRVTEAWNRSVIPALAERWSMIADVLESRGGVQADVIALFRDPKLLESKMRISQYGVMESLRGVLPDIWKELVVLSSERQLAAVVLARERWYGLSEEKRQEFARVMGLEQPKEVEVVLDCAAFLGKFIDHAYLKQIELADAPGGSSPTPLGGTSEGVRYLYDVPEESRDGIVKKNTFRDVFPHEFERFGISCQVLAKKIKRSVADNSLPQTYKELPDYLDFLAETYASAENDPEKIFKNYHDLVSRSRKLALESKCPMMLIPQACDSVAGDAGKIDVELRLGVRTLESLKLEEKLNQFRALADEYLKSAAHDLVGEWDVPPLLVNYQPFAFGPNNYFRTRGEAGDEQILAHTNAVEDVALVKAFPALQKVFVGIPSEKDFLAATLIDNTLHEFGHRLVPDTDEKVKERTGGNKIIEELKADSGDMKIVEMALMAGNPPVNAEHQLMAKLGDVCDYLQNKSSEPGTGGERYYFDGVAIITRLFDKGIVREVAGGKYEVTDHRAGVREVAALADEVLHLYRAGKPEDFTALAGVIKAQSEDKRVRDFVAKLKA